MAFGIEPKPDNKINIDYSHCTPVAVIVNFNREGKLMPVYLSLEDLYGNVCKAKIDGIKYTKDKKGCITYCCLISNGHNRQQQINLTFYIRDHLWVLEN